MRKEEGKEQINCSSHVLLADVNPIFYANFLHLPFFTTPFHAPSGSPHTLLTLLSAKIVSPMLYVY